MNDKIIEIHNRDAGRIVSEIVSPTIAAGGSFTDVLVLLESATAGVLTVATKAGGVAWRHGICARRSAESLSAENARLRDALKKIRDLKTRPIIPWTHKAAADEYMLALYYARYEARQALGDAPDAKKGE